MAAAEINRNGEQVWMELVAQKNTEEAQKKIKHKKPNMTLMT